MATSYTSSLRLALPVTGELNGTWGDVVNQQITSLVDQAVAGFQSVVITGNYTLSTTNGAVDESRNMMLKFTGTLAADANVVVPTANKLYFIHNATTGGFAITVKTSAGTGVTIANGLKMVVYCDGTNVVDAVTSLASPTISGNVTLNSGTANQVQFLNASKVLSGSTNLTFDGTTLTAAGFSGPISGNASSATKLATARTIWGQSFDGTANVSGALTGVTDITASGNVTLSGGTANGVPYLNASKVLTSGSALTFDGTNFSVNGNISLSGAGTGSRYVALLSETNTYAGSLNLQAGGGSAGFGGGITLYGHSHATYPGAVWIGQSYASTTGVIFGSGGNGVLTEWMRLTSTGLGLGTSSPGYKLDVTGDVRASNYVYGTAAFIGPLLLHTGASDLQVSHSGAYSVTFSTNGSERMRVNSSGNVGIGTSSPGYKLDVAGKINASSDVSVRNASYAVVDLQSTNAGSTSRLMNSQDGGGYLSIASSISTTAKPIGFSVSSSGESMRLDASGNLGLGVTPSGWGTSGNLELKNGAYLAFAGQYGYVYSNTYYSGGIDYYKTSAPAAYYAQFSGQHRWFTAPSGTAGNPITFTQAMTLDASGNLLVGTTTATSKMTVYNAVSDVITGKTDTVGAAPLVAWNTATSGNNYFAVFSTEGTITTRGTITYNRAGGLTVYNTTSDYRAKDIIGPVENTGTTIDALNVYLGKMKGATIERPMLIAHEAQAVAPYAVTGEKDAVDTDGNPVYQQIDVSSLVPLLIAEVQSLRKRLAAAGIA